jgi:uncharacterized protein GlcG (DUF336 family)
MILRKSMTIVDARRIAAAAEQEATSNDLKVCIAVVDDGGHLLHFQRLDDAPLLSISIAIGKARAAAYGRRSSKSFENVIDAGRLAFLTVANQTEGIVLLEGAEPIIVDGVCLGAVGVSGAKPDQDTQVARAGAITPLSSTPE